MKYLYKVILIALMGLLVLSVSACGDEGKQSDDSTTSYMSSESEKIPEQGLVDDIEGFISDNSDMLD